MRHVAFALAIGVYLCASSARAGTFSVLVQFTGSGGTASGANPLGSLIASGGTLYGMTAEGGGNGVGNIFSVGTNGTNYRDLVDFTGTGGTASGEYPAGSLIATGGTLYGMTSAWRHQAGYGNIFSVGTNGSDYQNLLSFTGTGGAANGDDPLGSLILSGTRLYGMTSGGGVHGGATSSAWASMVPATRTSTTSPAAPTAAARTATC